MLDNPIPWPNGARCAVAITWDVDCDSGLNYYNPERADNLVASQSQVRYDAAVAVPRLVKLLKRLEMRQTFFVPGWCIEKFPASMDSLIAGGHELALHGYLHERPNELSPEEELRVLRFGVEAFRRHTGARPRGWRAPSFAFSKHSLGYLIAEGFTYDSSLMGDDVPYVLRHETGSLLELPTEWCLDDWPHYVHNRDFRHQMPISPPSRAIEVFRAEFDAAWKHGALWVSVWHPFVSGRLSRLEAVIGLIEYMQSKGNVWFATLGEIADHVKALADGGRWMPRVDNLPYYTSPIPEIAKPAIVASAPRKRGT
ncbi:MAG: polysaccharide deacetylase family protein [Alphaproteobacteria bacterium]